MPRKNLVPVDMGGQKITGLGTPTAGTDAVTKAYADALGGGAGASRTTFSNAANYGKPSFNGATAYQPRILQLGFHFERLLAVGPVQHAPAAVQLGQRPKARPHPLVRGQVQRFDESVTGCLERWPPRTATRTSLPCRTAWSRPPRMPGWTGPSTGPCTAGSTSDRWRPPWLLPATDHGRSGKLAHCLPQSERSVRCSHFGPFGTGPRYR